MPFRSRILLPNDEIPTRGYVHLTGFDVFGTDEEAKRYLSGILGNEKGLLAPPEGADFTYIIAALWGNNHDKVAELFQYWGNEWPGNPEMRPFVFNNGIWVPRPYSTGCSETVRVLGREEEYRMKTPDLSYFMAYHPDIFDIQNSFIATI